MTSDTRRKEIAVEFKIGNRAVRIGGICKGAGMIQPGMSPPARDHARIYHERCRHRTEVLASEPWKRRCSKVSIASRSTAT